MKTYLDICQEILDTKTNLSDNRTGIKTLRNPAGATFIHDMDMGFPLVTTKKMGLKNIATELEFFIKGITDKKWLQDRKCTIWDEWASATKWQRTFQQKLANAQIEKQRKLTDQEIQELKNQCMNAERDLGPIYGFQWRHFGGKYEFDPARIDKDATDNYDITNRGIDQVSNAIEKLKTDPTNRRIIVNAWNPVDEYKMALPPCHIMHQLLVDGNRLNLIWTQRSCDMFLGVPYNIASYALLLMLYSKEAGLKPGILKGELHDAHIYENHIPQMREQISRTPYELPTVEIPDENWNGMLAWESANGFKLKNYKCHDRLRGDVAR